MKAVMDDDTEGLLVERAQGGDLAAYMVLVQRYQERIHKTIYRLTRSRDDTDDLAQETFLRAFKELRRFRRRSGFYTWIYRVALNLSFNHLKKRKREMSWQEYADRPLDWGRRTVWSPEAASSAGELQERLAEAVDSLPKPYRSAFILVASQGLTHSQAARVLGCSEKTVSWRMHKARKMLQAGLLPLFKEVSDEM